jgi:hypothetical protein
VVVQLLISPKFESTDGLFELIHEPQGLQAWLLPLAALADELAAAEAAAATPPELGGAGALLLGAPAPFPPCPSTRANVTAATAKQNMVEKPFMSILIKRTAVCSK